MGSQSKLAHQAKKVDFSPMVLKLIFDFTCNSTLFSLLLDKPEYNKQFTQIVSNSLKQRKRLTLHITRSTDPQYFLDAKNFSPLDRLPRKESVRSLQDGSTQSVGVFQQDYDQYNWISLQALTTANTRALVEHLPRIEHLEVALFSITDAMGDNFIRLLRAWRPSLKSLTIWCAHSTRVHHFPMEPDVLHLFNRFAEAMFRQIVRMRSNLRHLVLEGVYIPTQTNLRDLINQIVHIDMEHFALQLVAFQNTRPFAERFFLRDTHMQWNFNWDCGVVLPFEMLVLTGDVCLDRLTHMAMDSRMDLSQLLPWTIRLTTFSLDIGCLFDVPQLSELLYLDRLTYLRLIFPDRYQVSPGIASLSKFHRQTVVPLETVRVLELFLGSDQMKAFTLDLAWIFPKLEVLRIQTSADYYSNVAPLVDRYVDECNHLRRVFWAKGNHRAYMQIYGEETIIIPRHPGPSWFGN